MPSPVAIITGAASGIGEALTQNLLAKEWRVVMVDINVIKGRSLAEELGSNVVFYEIDVSFWEAKFKLFEQAHKWSGHRFDFLASNAGVADTRNLAEGLVEEDGALKRPNYKPIETNLIGSIYSFQLFAHYVGKRKNDNGGKIVLTSSGAGQFECQVIPYIAHLSMG